MPVLTATSMSVQDSQLAGANRYADTIARPSPHGGPMLGDHIDLKLLVICPHASDPTLAAIRTVLDAIGIRYDVLATNMQRLTPARLWVGSHARYQGIVLTTGGLAHGNATPSNWDGQSDLQGWRLLQRYRSRFGVRQVTLFSQPEDSPEEVGLQIDEFVDTYVTPLTLTLTEAGREVFWYLNPNVAIPVKSVAAYTAHSSDSAVIPLLVTAGGETLAAIRRQDDGSEHLALTMAQGSGLAHTMLLGYGLINWVTRGLFVGQRRMYLCVQVDDLFNSNHLWNTENEAQGGEIYRMDGRDVQALVDWRERLHRDHPNLSGFTLDLAFNGAGVAQAQADDGLVSSIMPHQAKFRWINHGYTHLLLHDASAERSLGEIRRNHELADQLGLVRYDRQCMVTADMSGLDNAQFLGAAHEAGIRYLVSDTSRPHGDNPSFNVGNPSTHQPDILIIPRHPNNLFYDVSTPAQWVSQYNHIYRDFWGRDLTFEEILDAEAAVILRYIMSFDMDPLMFHQANLRAYDGTHSLLSDLIDRVMNKYDRLFGDVPITNLSMSEIGQAMNERAAYEAAEVNVSLIVGTGLVLTANRDVTIALTGVRASGANDSYAGQSTSLIPLRAYRRWVVPVTELRGYEPL